MPKIDLVASSTGAIKHKASKLMTQPKPLRFIGGPADQVVLFLLKVAALEAVRRFSKARCPFVWRVVQALQFLGYPPLRWIQRWKPFGTIIKGVQKFSRPMVVLSIATVFTDHFENCKKKTDSVDDSQQDSESPNEPSTSDVRQHIDTSKNIESKNRLLRLLGELEKKGISLPARIDEDELQRFYTAANGDLSCVLSSLKKTVRWRETYKILSIEELEPWLHLVFWHGYDVKFRPVLVIRLGHACSSLLSHDRPRFVQAIVSQIEHGVLHLVNEADSRIIVLMDCEGLPPLKFPMQMMRYCSTLVQDHYPNRLGTLFLIRLAPVARVIAQTFIQVLKPTTRQKLRIEGEAYLKVLSEFLQIVPAYLGGECTCSKCTMLLAGNTWELRTEITSKGEASQNNLNYESSPNTNPFTQHSFGDNCEQVLRFTILVILMMWIAVAFLFHFKISGSDDTSDSL